MTLRVRGGRVAPLHLLDAVVNTDTYGQMLYVPKQLIRKIIVGFNHIGIIHNLYIDKLKRITPPYQNYYSTIVNN